MILLTGKDSREYFQEHFGERFWYIFGTTKCELNHHPGLCGTQEALCGQERLVVAVAERALRLCRKEAAVPLWVKPLHGELLFVSE